MNEKPGWRLQIKYFGAGRHALATVLGLRLRGA